MSGLDIADLDTMSPAALRAAWREVHRKPAPDLSPDLLRRGIAYNLQARRHGGLSTAVRSEIARLTRRLEQDDDLTSPGTIALKPGTRLVRAWHGKTHHVLVCDEGFDYKGRHYRSLSQIARKITGTRWSGPRFFGLKSRNTSGLRNQRAA